MFTTSLVQKMLVRTTIVQTVLVRMPYRGDIIQNAFLSIQAKIKRNLNLTHVVLTKNEIENVCAWSRKG